MFINKKKIKEKKEKKKKRRMGINDTIHWSIRDVPRKDKLT